ncbi:helix-turn-helix transcriptional regulator [Rhodococcus spelaei]|uniref:Helix-turn-helix transcriptional regulator n=1 Tax=Rhodococcus spelaei TaxID=2546320 RepID=A0A541BNK3_9NOCA|nr:metalloregulator ArsR/SmtB family transcription factor [Rhodococcus spelaei]TQF73874.1 helix-turn-helix transcriptional regulator [Rhodococcus spelaei]
MVQYSRLDITFAALADPTRRGILEHLGRADATVSELAERFEMTLTGITKHLRLLEQAGMIETEKHGRVRHCRLGTNPLDREAAWIRGHQLEIEGRMDRLGQFLNRTEE